MQSNDLLARIFDSPIEVERKANIILRFATHDHAFKENQK